MYWYFKYPLLLFVIVILSGICVFIWRVGVEPYFHKGENKEVVERAVGGEAEEPASVSKEAQGVKQEAVKAASADVESGVSGDMLARLMEAKQHLQNDFPNKARGLALECLGQCEPFSRGWYEFAQIVNDANKAFMNGTAPCPEKKRYSVVRGDNLVKIAYKLNTTVEALQKLNNLSVTSPTIFPGQTLQYIDGVRSIVVSKGKFTLCVYLDGVLYRIYKVSVGKTDRTPVGEFHIQDKVMNPVWHFGGKVYQAGDPENTLGTRWMALEASTKENMDLKGYGIHGTIEPDSIGKAASLGCVRMLNEEVEELYDFIPSSYKKQRITVTIVD